MQATGQHRLTGAAANQHQTAQAGPPLSDPSANFKVSVVAGDPPASAERSRAAGLRSALAEALFR